MGLAEDLNRMATLASEAARHAASGQRAALDLLLAEMRALSALLPGVAPDMTEAEAQARERAHDAEVEADFDNMPV